MLAEAEGRWEECRLEYFKTNFHKLVRFYVCCLFIINRFSLSISIFYETWGMASWTKEGGGMEGFDRRFRLPFSDRNFVKLLNAWNSCFICFWIYRILFHVLNLIYELLMVFKEFLFLLVIVSFLCTLWFV